MLNQEEDVKKKEKQRGTVMVLPQSPISPFSSATEDGRDRVGREGVKMSLG